MADVLRAIEHNAQLQFELGAQFEKEKEFAKALRWFKQAALNDHLQAAYRAGMLCVGNRRWRKDALFWFQKAASHYYAPAEYQISLIYSAGVEVEADVEKAAHWLRLAIQHGSKEALLKLKMVSSNLPSLKTNHEPKSIGKVAEKGGYL